MPSPGIVNSALGPYNPNAADVNFGDEGPKYGIFLDEATQKTLSIVDMQGTTITYNNLALGVWHPIAVRKLLQAGTTATRVFVRNT